MGRRLSERAKRAGLFGTLFTGVALLGLSAALFVAKAPASGTAQPTQPGASHEKVTICHATGSATNPYVEITVNFNSIEDARDVKGHVRHGDDIIPPYSYSDPQGSITFPGQGDQSILTNGCKAGTTTSTTTPSTSTNTTTSSTSTTTSSTSTSTSTGSTSTPTTTSATTSTGGTTTTGTTATGTTETTSTGTTPGTTSTTTPVGGTTTGATPPGSPSGSVPPPKAPKPRGSSTARGNSGDQGGLPNTGWDAWLYALLGSGLLLTGAPARILTKPKS